MSDATVSLSILAAVVVLFVWNRFPVELVAVGAALALFFSGVLTLDESLAGFGDPAVILIAALFVVSEGLDATGVTTWLGRTLAEKSGGSARRLLVFTMLLSAGLTALIGLNGTVAALLPMAVMVAVQRGYPTSQLLMPLAFAGSAGGLLLLTGSPVNVVISEAAADAGVGAFGLAEFALVGIPLVAGTVLIVLALGNRLLPERESSMVPPDLSRQAAVLVEHYSLDNVFHLRAGPSSGLLGRTRARWDLDGYPGIKVITVLDAASQRPVSDGLVGVGDRITVVGDPDVARRYAADHELRVEAVRGAADIAQSLLTRESGAAEVVIPPRSRFVGEEVSPGKVVLGGSLIILAIERQGRDQGPGTTVLQAGDTLLVEGDWASLTEAIGRPRRARRRLPGPGPPSGGAAGPGLDPGDRRARGHGGPARDRDRPARGRRAAGGRRYGPAPGRLRAAGLPGDFLDDRAPRGGDDPDVDCHYEVRRRREGRGDSRGRRRRRGAPRAARRPVRPDRGLRPAHQQHCDGARGHPDRGLGSRPARRLRPSRVDERVRRGRGCVPHARGHAREHDGDGTGRLPVWRLLETWAGVGPAVFRRVGRVGPARVEVLMALRSHRCVPRKNRSTKPVLSVVEGSEILDNFE